MKKLIASISIALLLSWNFSQAVTITATVAAGKAWNATNIIDRSATVTRILIDTGSSGGATNLVYALNDFPGYSAANGWGEIMKTNGSYTAVGSYLTNITKITTNFGSGDGAGNYVTFTNTFTNALYTYTTTVGQTSNAWRVIASGTVGSNSTATALSGDYPLIYGLGFTNNNIGKDITLTIDYTPSL